MARYVLQPCKLREDQLVPQKGVGTVEYDWNKLQETFAPSKSRTALLNISNLRVGQYVGLVRRADASEVTNFTLMNQDRTGRVDWLLKKDPSFEKRLVSVYKVEVAERDARIEERDTTEANPFRDADRRRMVEGVARR